MNKRLKWQHLGPPTSSLQSHSPLYTALGVWHLQLSLPLPSTEAHFTAPFNMALQNANLLSARVVHFRVVHF